MIYKTPSVEKGKWLPVSKKWLYSIGFWIYGGARPEVRSWNRPVLGIYLGSKNIEVFV